MGTILQAIIGFFAGGVGQKLGSGVTNVLTLAAFAPFAYWLLENKEGVAVTVTYGELAFWSLVIAAVLKAAHYTRSPGQ